MARALYIHWPFCVAKCPYCDFNSHVRDRIDLALWLKTLLADLRYESTQATVRSPLTSIFFGGGTPSLMPPELVETLLNEAERIHGFAPDIEITLEANPSSVETANFAALSAAGINRVSLGVQSLRENALQLLGRMHDTADAIKAVETAQSHFDRVSIDLIYARPNQTPAEWQIELREALALGTDHLSLYQLTIEPGTRFATDVRRGELHPLDDDAAADLFAITRMMTEHADLVAYEVSNHARQGQESRQNLTYWRYQDYLAIGPGAHGRRNGVATVRHRKPENYLEAVASQHHGIAEERQLSKNEMASEALLMGLRLSEGVDLDLIASRFDIAVVELVDDAKLRLYADLGLVALEGNHITVTPQGMPLLDALLGELVSPELVAS